MFNAIDDSARNVASKLSNWVLNLPFWPEGLVGELIIEFYVNGQPRKLILKSESY